MADADHNPAAEQQSAEVRAKCEQFRTTFAGLADEILPLHYYTRKPAA